MKKTLVLLMLGCCPAFAGARVRGFGDSILCGFRLTLSAIHAADPNLYCNVPPNPAGGNPTYAYFAIAMQTISARWRIDTSSNLGITGTTLAGQTPPTCVASGHSPDIVLVAYGANDLQGAGSAATFNANLAAYVTTAVANGCKVIIATITPRNLVTESVRLAANTNTRNNYVSWGASALMDIGGDPNMGQSRDNEVGFTVADGQLAQVRYNLLDCDPSCPNGTLLTHPSDTGAAYEAPLLVNALNIVLTANGGTPNSTSVFSGIAIGGKSATK